MMKQHLFIFSIIAFLNIQNIVAQSIVSKRYGNGQPKIRIFLRGQDTITREWLLENGNLYARHWKDSSYYYAPNQAIFKKRFGQGQNCPYH
jgi:hypothetical protein